MSLLSSDDLTQMRATVESGFDKSCAVRRLTKTPNSAGGSSESWASVVTVACRIRRQRMVAIEGVEADRLTAVAGWEILLPHGTEVRQADLLRVDGRDYEVLNVDLDKSDATELLVECKLVGLAGA